MPDPISRLNAALEGRYRIERQLGEGGMATVYLADDLRHERKVALKVLKPELAAVVGAERFLAEIKTTANLQHPHILPLFDSGEADTFLFYVMPFVEGESLRARLDREHQLPVNEAVQIAKDVAEALQAAHDQGVIHRDVKPANILLSKGRPLVSDFGIALALGAAGAGRLTETGLSLGTPHYMSPEQATGDLSVGAATDIYALGCVLYEMLVGEPPYTGGTPQAVLGKIIAGETASATKQRASVPQNVDAAIKKALEKVPADRFASGQELARALGDQGFRHGEPARVGVGATSTPWNRLAVAGWVAAGILGATTAWSLARPALRATTSLQEPTRLTVPPPPGIESFSPVISPDERTIVYVGWRGASNEGLFRRDLGRLEATRIAGSDNAFMPSFSPDGEWVAFIDDLENVLKRVRLDGSEVQTLSPAPASGRSAAWLGDGTIVFNSSGLGGLSRIPESGGEPEPVARSAGTILWLDPLPGYEALLGKTSPSINAPVVAVSLETGEQKELLSAPPLGQARYVRSGHIVYWRDEALWAAPFDVEVQEVTGPPTSLVQGVRAGTNGLAEFAVSENLLVYGPGGLGGTASGFPVWVDREGNQESLPVPPGLYHTPRLSPDGMKVALVRSQESEDIWIYDQISGAFTQFTFDPADDRNPVWTPDGERVVFTSDRDGPFSLYWRRANGTDDVERLAISANTQIPYDWTPDGSALLFMEEDPDTGWDIWSLSTEAGATPVRLTQEDYAESRPALSPSGDYLAYESGERGYPEIFVQPFPDLVGGWMVSTLDVAPLTGMTNADQREGRSVRWSPDGAEIFYRAGQVIVSVPVSTDGTFTFGVPQVVTEPASNSGFWANASRGLQYDVGPDGRFLTIVSGLGITSSDLVVVQNWRTELAQQPSR